MRDLLVANHLSFNGRTRVRLSQLVFYVRQENIDNSIMLVEFRHVKHVKHLWTTFINIFDEIVKL